MTAPTTPAATAPATAATDQGGGDGATTATPEPGQAPATGTSTGTGNAPAAKPKPPQQQQNVRAAAREDDAPREPATTDGGGNDDAKPEGGKDWKVEDLPPGAQKLIADLRKESGTRRAEAQENKKAAEAAIKKATAGDERFANATEAFMKALGLTPEPDEPERSPEELLGEMTSRYQQSRVELAVYRAAGGLDADPDALLDSRGFVTKAHALDPAADDFDTAIADAIAEAVENNPKLRAEQPVPTPAPVASAPSGGDFGGGPADRNNPDEWSVDDFRRNRLTGGRAY